MGWHVAGGLALVLDFLDPDAAHDFDQDLGVNHTAITFEFFHSDISGLGESNRLHVGDTDWTLGLCSSFEPRPPWQTLPRRRRVRRHRLFGLAAPGRGGPFRGRSRTPSAR